MVCLNSLGGIHSSADDDETLFLERLGGHCHGEGLVDSWSGWGDHRCGTRTLRPNTEATQTPWNKEHAEKQFFRQPEVPSPSVC